MRRGAALNSLSMLLVLETGVQVGVALKEDGCASVARLFMTPACSSVACAGSSLAHHLLSSAATAAIAERWRKNGGHKKID